MKISGIMYISRILIDLCARRQKIKIKKTFADIVYDGLEVKKFYNNIKRFLWK